MKAVTFHDDRVTITMNKSDYDELAAEAVVVDDLAAHDREYSGGGKLADLVLQHCIHDRDQLAQPDKPRVYYLKAGDTVPPLANGDSVVIAGNPMILLES